MKIILALLLLAAAHPLSAQPDPVMQVSETVQSSYTISGVAISSSVGTGVIISTASMIRWVAVENLDSSANLFCSPRPGVSASTGTTAGWEIAHGNSYKFVILPGSQFYCINDGGSASVWAVVYQGR